MQVINTGKLFSKTQKIMSPVISGKGEEKEGHYRIKNQDKESYHTSKS
jgi:hypothetical protein